VVLEKVNFNICDFALLIGFSQFDDPGLKPSSYRMINVKSVVQPYKFGRLPLFKYPARINTEHLIVLGMPASIMNEDLVVLDAENLGIKPEVDFIEDVDILAYEK
jgi:hypothetical protein